MLKRTRIKICGMTQASQVTAAVAYGVDSIGVILHANSPRAISLEQAEEIRKVIPAFVSMVGVFVNADKQFIEQAVDFLKLDLIQLHGDESDQFGQQLSRPYVKAIRAKNTNQVLEDITKFPAANAILFDPYVQDLHGGTGQTLDTQLWPQEHHQALILAGGLSAENIGPRISQMKPYAVDFNSGLEIAPGDKSDELMLAAIEAVRRADAL